MYYYTIVLYCTVIALLWQQLQLPLWLQQQQQLPATIAATTAVIAAIVAAIVIKQRHFLTSFQNQMFLSWF